MDPYNRLPNDRTRQPSPEHERLIQRLKAEEEAENQRYEATMKSLERTKEIADETEQRLKSPPANPEPKQPGNVSQRAQRNLGRTGMEAMRDPIGQNDSSLRPSIPPGGELRNTPPVSGQMPDTPPWLQDKPGLPSIRRKTQPPSNPLPPDSK